RQHILHYVYSVLVALHHALLIEETTRKRRCSCLFAERQVVVVALQVPDALARLEHVVGGEVVDADHRRILLRLQVRILDERAELAQVKRVAEGDRKSTRLNSSHVKISY